MVLFALAVGFVIGLIVWAVYWASSFLTELLWTDGRNALAGMLGSSTENLWWIPLIFCSFGGLIIGLFTWKFGGSPESLEKVLGTVKATGGYKLEKPGASIVGFLLPLIFGGSVGPEAGLTGIIAASCTRIGRSLRSAGLRVKGIADVTISAALSAIFATPLAGIVATAEDGMPTHNNPDKYELRRKAKLVLYTSSALGAVAGIAAFTAVFGSESGMPRFDGIIPGDIKLLWALPCLAIGYLGALIYHNSDAFFEAASEALGNRPILKPVIAGVLLGIFAIPMPYILFPGEAQAFEIIENWQTMGAFIMIITGLSKCVATPLCLHFGWKGGHFFPCIFAGIIAGYGIASLSGVDPMFCVALTTASLIAGVQQKPLMALALLLLCFPVSSIIWMGIACVIGAALPFPTFIQKGKGGKATNTPLRK